MKRVCVHTECESLRFAAALSMKWVALYLLLIIPLIKPDAISQWSSLAKLDSLYRLWKYASLLLILTIILLEYRTFVLSSFTVVLALSVMFLGVSTEIHGQNTMASVINPWIGFIAMALLVDESIRQRPRELLIALLILFSILLLINLYFVLTSPPIAADEESSLHVFLGQKNSVRNYVLPAVCISFCLANMRVAGARTWGIVLTLVGIVSQVLFYSATGVVVTLVFTLCCLFPDIMKCITKPIGLLIPAVLNWLIVFARIPFLSEFVISVLHKDSNFTGRNIIWNASILRIKESPLFGKGSDNTELANAVSQAANSSHNALLDITYKGGFVALAAFIALYLLSFFRLYNSPATHNRSILLSALLLFLISGIFENLSYIGFFIILQLSFHSNVIKGEGEPNAN